MIKALIVENDVEFRHFVRGLLAERFPEGVIDEATNAAEALQLVAERRHDIVLLDIGMRGQINGLGLIARIRERGTRPPILTISNETVPAEQLEAARLGADWFLPKAGCDPQHIIAAVERLTMLGADGLPQA